jgi:inorganic pyrophosphatase
MATLIDLGSRDDAGTLRVVVETPKGSIAKLKYNPRFGTFELQRFISNAGYPYDWGFVPSTLAQDGDPLDAMVIHDGHTWPGVVIPCVAIALLRLSELKIGEAESRRNDRVIAMPAPSLRAGSQSALGPELRAQLEQFFVATGELANKRVSLEGWGNESEAAEAVARASQAYDARGKQPAV